MNHWKPIREIEYLVIHCSATPEDMDIGVQEIKLWHLQRGFRDVGYHKVIRRDGTIENGRSEDVPGAHARGYNEKSLAVCLVGGTESDKRTPEANFTHAQWDALEEVIKMWKAVNPDAQVLGHRDLPNVSKSCPSFDAVEWWASRN